MLPAYRPINVITMDNGATGIPPEVYCDVYFDGVYYKTLSSNVPTTVLSGTSFWTFDLSGLAQEYIKTNVYDITLNTLTQIYGPSTKYGQVLTWFKIRISTQDSYGVITPGGPLPVQATFNTAAAAGGGYTSDQQWYTVNATLQVQDSMGLEWMFKAFRVSGVYDPSGHHVNGLYKAYQLSYLTKGYSYINDYGQMPIITANNAFLGFSTASVVLLLRVYNSTGVQIHFESVAYVSTLSSNCIYTMPIGLKNVIPMFPGLTLHLPDTAYYRVGFSDAFSGSEIYMTPPIYYLKNDGSVNGINYMVPTINTSVPKHTRIWFKNYLGQFDAWNFIERNEALNVKSDAYEFPLTLVPDGFVRSNTSRGRYNVRSSEVNTVVGLFNEDQLQFIKQLLATSQAYIEFTSPEGPDDTPPTALLLPIVIVDGDFNTQSWDDRYEYALAIKYIPSNENIIVR